MATKNLENANANLKRLMQRQLTLLDFQDRENEYGLRTWPNLPGLTARQSERVFMILERWGWIAGSPFRPNEFKCAITSKGAERLAKINVGQPLMEATGLIFLDDDHSILDQVASESPPADKSKRSRSRKVISWISRHTGSRDGLWTILFLGIVLIMVGVHFSKLDGLMLISRGTLSVMLGFACAVGSLRWGFQSVERRYPTMSWLPVGISLLLSIPIAVALFNGTLGIWFAVCLATVVGIAGIPLPNRGADFRGELTKRR